MIRLPYPPSLNRYLRHTGRTYKTAEAVAFARQAALAAKLAGVGRTDTDVAVDITLHPKLTKRGQASNTLIDLDNALKVAIDALNGIAYQDDSQIKRLTAEVGAPTQGGGLSIQVSTMGKGPASPVASSDRATRPTHLCGLDRSEP